jgi:hypothetical protein
MKRFFFLYKMGALVLVALLLGFGACSLDVTNPNSASEDQVLTTREGIMALAVGMQQYYAVTALEPIILATGITSSELAANSTFLNLIELQDGGNKLTTGNANVLALWSRNLRVVSMANDLIQNAPTVTLAEGTRSGVLALAQLHKAMAMGALAQNFEQAPIDLDKDGKAVFKPRPEVFAAAIGLLDNALATITATPASSEFTSQVMGKGLDLTNTIQAYRARYNLFAGRHQQALEAANAVSLTAKSTFTYDDRNPNPIYTAVFVSRNYAPRDNFGTPLAEANDARIAFYTSPSTAVSVSPYLLPIETLKGFFDASTKAIPLYLPGEVRLIKAEAQVRLGNLTAAVTEIDAIRTKTAAQDPFGIGAGLPAYSGATTADALLTEIYRQRSAELFLTGLRLEDSRRLNRPGPGAANAERNRNFYPYPDQERINNPGNTPPDPAN